jgi:hypothetical protein
LARLHRRLGTDLSLPRLGGRRHASAARWPCSLSMVQVRMRRASPKGQDDSFRRRGRRLSRGRRVSRTRVAPVVDGRQQVTERCGRSPRLQPERQDAEVLGLGAAYEQEQERGRLGKKGEERESGSGCVARQLTSNADGETERETQQLIF